MHEKPKIVVIFLIKSRPHAYWPYFGSIIGPVRPRSLWAGLVSVFGGFCTPKSEILDDFSSKMYEKSQIFTIFYMSIGHTLDR